MAVGETGYIHTFEPRAETIVHLVDTVALNRLRNRSRAENPPPASRATTSSRDIAACSAASPPPVMEYLLRVCLERLQRGGYAFFQLPCYLYNDEFRLADYLNRPTSGLTEAAAREMHALPQARVFRVLAEAGLVAVEVLPYPRIGPIGFSYVFTARKPR